jgi:RNA-directed DNA polymerase
VQEALMLVLEAIFEANFCPNSYGFPPTQSPHQALAEVRRSLMRRMSTVIDADLAKYFDTFGTTYFYARSLGESKTQESTTSSG